MPGAAGSCGMHPRHLPIGTANGEFGILRSWYRAVAVRA